MNHQWLMTHCRVSSPEEASEVAAPDPEPRPSVSPKDLHLGEGKASESWRQCLDDKGDQRDRDPGGQSGDENRRGWLPVPPVGGADSKPERAGDRCLHDDPDSPNQERDRARGEHRDQRRPRSLPSRKRGEGDDRQALKGGSDKGDEPPKYLEHQRQIA